MPQLSDSSHVLSDESSHVDRLASVIVHLFLVSHATARVELTLEQGREAGTRRRRRSFFREEPPTARTPATYSEVVSWWSPRMSLNIVSVPPADPTRRALAAAGVDRYLWGATNRLKMFCENRFFSREFLDKHALCEGSSGSGWGSA